MVLVCLCFWLLVLCSDCGNGIILLWMFVVTACSFWRRTILILSYLILSTGTEIEPDEDANNAGWRKWVERKDRALANIVLAVEPSLLYMLGDPKDPADVWQKLADQFEKKSWANKLALRRKLYSLRLKENESVQNHIKSMVEIFESLSVVGYVVEEEDRVE